jgi:hypothetical protein
MEDEFITARHMDNGVAQSAGYRFRGSDEPIDGESIYYSLNHALKLLMNVDKKVEMMGEELLKLTHPNYKPIPEADLPVDRKPTYWLS